MALFALVTASTLALAPAGGSPADLRLEQPAPEPQPIVGGMPVGEQDYGAIVALLTSRSGLCTGTVVSPRVIITAAHCLADLDADATVDVFFGNELDFSMSTEAAGFAAHPEFCEDCKQDLYDYGYVLLSSDFSPPGGLILPITDQDEWDDVMVTGGDVTLVGYGEDPDAEDPSDSLGTKRFVETSIRRFSKLGLEFFAGGEGMDSCQGDSGGPALVELSDGTVRLAGVTSRGSDPCGDGGFYGVPFPALEWLRDETGVDLLPADCADGSCLDISPPSQDTGRCSVSTDSRDGFGSAMVLMLLGLAGRRRSRRSCG